MFMSFITKLEKYIPGRGSSTMVIFFQILVSPLPPSVVCAVKALRVAPEITDPKSTNLNLLTGN